MIHRGSHEVITIGQNLSFVFLMSRQRRPQSWYSHSKSFGTVGIQFSKIENYVLHQYLCDWELRPCATSALVYCGLFSNKPPDISNKPTKLSQG